MRKFEALKIRANIETGVQSIPDESALETVSLFPVCAVYGDCGASCFR